MEPMTFCRSISVLIRVRYSSQPTPCEARLARICSWLSPFSEAIPSIAWSTSPSLTWSWASFATLASSRRSISCSSAPARRFASSSSGAPCARASASTGPTSSITSETSTTSVPTWAAIPSLSTSSARDAGAASAITRRRARAPRAMARDLVRGFEQDSPRPRRRGCMLQILPTAERRGPPLVEGLRRLVELQKLDDELATLEEEHRALPARREALAAQQAAAEERLAAGREALRTAELAQRQAERELQEREAGVSRLEGQQFQVKTNEAYTALLREIDHARAAVSVCETRILEAMEAIESSGAAVAAAEGEAKASGERAQAGMRTLAAREAELDGRIAELRGRRAEARGRIERDLVELYERISSRKRPAVVTVTREICTGCRVDIPPQRFVEILSRERVVTCGRCQRILVLAGA